MKFKSLKFWFVSVFVVALTVFIGASVTSAQTQSSAGSINITSLTPNPATSTITVSGTAEGGETFTSGETEQGEGCTQNPDFCPQPTPFESTTSGQLSNFTRQYTGGTITSISSNVTQTQAGTISIIPPGNIEYRNYTYSFSFTVDVSTLASGSYTMTVRALDEATGTTISATAPFTIAGSVMSGTLIPASSSCTIASGASSCPKTLTWTTTNPIATSAVTNNGTATPASPSGNNSSALFTIPYNSTSDPYTGEPGTTNFYLYNNTVELAQADVTTLCVSGTVWNGTYCSPAPSTTGTISATNCEIANGASTCDSSVTWDTQNRVPGAITEITHNNPNNTHCSFATSGTNVNCTVKFGDTDFYLYHNSLQLAEDSITATCEAGTDWDDVSDICTSNPIDGYWRFDGWSSCNNGIETEIWTCVPPINGGLPCNPPPPHSADTRACSGPLPIDGICSSPAVHYACSAGTSVNNKSSPSRFTWNCNGLNGGNPSPQCVEKKSPIFIEN